MVSITGKAGCAAPTTNGHTSRSRANGHEPTSLSFSCLRCTYLITLRILIIGVLIFAQNTGIFTADEEVKTSSSSCGCSRLKRSFISDKESTINDAVVETTRTDATNEDHIASALVHIEVINIAASCG